MSESPSLTAETGSDFAASEHMMGQHSPLACRSLPACNGRLLRVVRPEAAVALNQFQARTAAPVCL
jgi:hypothetical protein